MRIGFKTTLEKELIKLLEMEAIKRGVNVNDILEELIDIYLRRERGYYQTIYILGDKEAIKNLENYLLETKFAKYKIAEGPEYNRGDLIHFVSKKEGGLITLSKKDDRLDIVRLDGFYGRQLLPKEYSEILNDFFNECIRGYAEDEKNALYCEITDLNFKLIPGWSEFE